MKFHVNITQVWFVGFCWFFCFFSLLSPRTEVKHRLLRDSFGASICRDRLNAVSDNLL